MWDDEKQKVDGFHKEFRHGLRDQLKDEATQKMNEENALKAVSTHVIEFSGNFRGNMVEISECV